MLLQSYLARRLKRLFVILSYIRLLTLMWLWQRLYIEWNIYQACFFVRQVKKKKECSAERVLQCRLRVRCRLVNNTLCICIQKKKKKNGELCICTSVWNAVFYLQGLYPALSELIEQCGSSLVGGVYKQTKCSCFVAFLLFR